MTRKTISNLSRRTLKSDLKNLFKLGELVIHQIQIRNRNLGINCSEHFYNLSPTMDPINWKLKNQPFKNEKIPKSNEPILKM